MDFLKRVGSLFFVLNVLFLGVYADPGDQDGESNQEELNEKDWRVLRDFVKSKRLEDLLEKSVDLTISGDVRTEWRHMNEKINGVSQRGGSATNFYSPAGVPVPGMGLPVSRNDFDIEFNLRILYIKDKTWAAAHVQYDNTAGVNDSGRPCETTSRTVDINGVPTVITNVGDPSGFHGSGRNNDVALKTAYFGYNLFDCGNHKLDLEIGRRGNLYKVFTSKVQFLQRLDGILFTYSGQTENLTDWYWKTAGFLVDERVNQFAWITEFGLLNILDSSVDVRYSFIDWKKNGTNRCFVRNPDGFRFKNSQFTLGYHFNPECLFGKSAKIYGAYIINHDAVPIVVTTPGQEGTENFNEPTAWYVGLEIGQVFEEGDWAFQAVYQHVGANSVPDGDSAGIGLGNVANTGTLQTGIHRGNTNFKGVKLEFLYAITDQLTLDAIFEHTRQINKKIGGRHSFSKVELETIYAF